MNVSSWLEHYGYGLLFIALFLEMLALPLPGEMMMSYAGLFVFEGELNWLLSMLISGAGVTAGVTLSYWIGYRLGKPFLAKYGERIHLGEKQLERMTVWFEKHGEKLLVVAYFIPGVRHITGYFCGVARMPFRSYALYAYSGAFLWTGTFITLGKVLGPKWELYHSTVNRYMLIFGVVSVVVSALFYLYKRNRKWIKDRAIMLIAIGTEQFHSLNKVKLLLGAAVIGFITFVSLMLGLIQDFLARDYEQFDEVAAYLIHTGFGENMTGMMKAIYVICTVYVFGSLVGLIVNWVLKRPKDWLLEISFLLWVVVGGGLMSEALRLLFHRTGRPIAGGGLVFNTFPSQATLTAFMVCGFSAYLIVRTSTRLGVHIAIVAAFIGVSVLVGISRIYLDVEFPSDVAAGYVFGGVWLSMNILLLELYRMMPSSAAAV